MTEFQKAVLAVVRLVPAGKVVSYGQVAAYAGSPGAARQVGWVMRSLSGTQNFPWWRVVNNGGAITIKGNELNSREQQRQMLIAEGVAVNNDMTLDIESYRFVADPKQLVKFQIR
jgi:methylated-DNA-protein-cysteine methyltransferase-like protein